VASDIPTSQSSFFLLFNFVLLNNLIELICQKYDTGQLNFAPSYQRIECTEVKNFQSNTCYTITKGEITTNGGLQRCQLSGSTSIISPLHEVFVLPSSSESQSSSSSHPFSSCDLYCVSASEAELSNCWRNILQDSRSVKSMIPTS